MLVAAIILLVVGFIFSVGERKAKPKDKRSWLFVANCFLFASFTLCVVFIVQAVNS